MEYTTRLLWLFIAVTCTVAGTDEATAMIDASISTRNDDPYRLPITVLPEHYEVILKLDENFGSTAVYTGSVKINISTTTAVQEIILHSKYLDINVTQTYLTCGEITYSADTNNISDYEMISLVLSPTNTIPAGSSCLLEFREFTGLLGDDMYGFYRSYYTDENDQTVWIATTQFQATHARRAFPCFDEPGFKATFNISIIHPQGYHSLANTPQIGNSEAYEDNLLIDYFDITPLMSTYLLAFVVSPFVYLENQAHNYRVYARREAVDTLTYSFVVGPPLLRSLERFTNMSYLDSNIGKLDQVAIPDFSAGAMENWGLVTYREINLLWDENESTNSYKQRIATVISHEFAHKWFGNLVTCDWWSYTWLNEGFARYYEYFTTADVETTWELEKQFVVEQVQTSLATDSLISTLPLTSNVSSPSEVSNKFTLISYNKGASIVRMMEHFMGHENFRDGLRVYLYENQFNNTVPEDLWNALQSFAVDHLPDGKSLSEVMGPWTERAGYPVIEVAMSEVDAVITQKRFLLTNASDSNDTSRWDVPITYTTSHGPDFTTTYPDLWLSAENDSAVIPNILHGGTGWVVLNIQGTGFYRVNYDDTLWREIENALKSDNFGGIDVINRALIVDDVFNLARAGEISYIRALDIVSYLENETEYYPWYSAFTAFTFLRRRIGQDDVLEPLLKEFIEHSIEKLYETVPFNVNNNIDQIYTLKKVLTLTWACQLEIRNCVDDALTAFEAFRNGTSLNANLKSVVYCNALRYSDTEDNWRLLWNRFLETKLAQEQVIILGALGCTRNESLINEYLTSSISQESGIRSQDATTVFTSVLNGNPGGVDLAFQFLRDNYVQIGAYYGTMNGLASLITTLADRFTTRAQVDQLEEFLESAGENLGNVQLVISSAIETANANIAWTASFSDVLVNWFTSSAFSVSPNIGLISFIVILTVKLITN